MPKTKPIEIEPMELEINDHTNCCGITHICDFWDNFSFREYLEVENYGVDKTDQIPVRNATFDDKVASIRQGVDRAIRAQGSYRNGPKALAIEATLASFQFRFWERALQHCGFRRKLEFLNSNSGNRVRIYYLVVGG